MVNLSAFRKHLEWAEGRCLKPYKDSVGKITIGVGRCLDDKGISERECDFLLTNDIDEVLAQCGALPYWDLLDDARQLCIADLVFNVGLAKFKKFVKLNAALQAGDFNQAAHEMRNSKWYAQVGRRAQKLEKAMLSGVWEGK